jgi:peroxiredoxin
MIHPARLRLGALMAMSVCALASAAGYSAYARQSDAPKAEKLTAAVLDKPVNDFKLRDVTKDLKRSEKAEDAMVQLASFKGKKNVILFFMSEQCSVTWRYERRVGKLMQANAKKDLAFLGVRCSANDTVESIRKFAEAKNFAMPVLNDEKGEVSKFFKVIQTPTFVLIDKQGVLRYRGSFDDNADEANVQDSCLPNAIKAVLAGKEVALKSHAVFG